jgi:hypothetical protein
LEGDLKNMIWKMKEKDWNFFELFIKKIKYFLNYKMDFKELFCEFYWNFETQFYELILA